MATLEPTRPELPPPSAEWLEPDGAGGFASGTVSGLRTRRYHGLLLAATASQGRYMMVSGAEVTLEVAGRSYCISPQKFWQDVVTPAPPEIVEFHAQPWPAWIWRIGGRWMLRHEVFVHRKTKKTCLRWELVTMEPGAKLHVRPFLSGRDYHATHHENAAFQFCAEVRGQSIRWQPYPSLPPISCHANASYAKEPLWYRNFQYTEEQARGLDCLEDLAAPGVLSFSIDSQAAALTLGCEAIDEAGDALEFVEAAREQEGVRREKLGGALCRSADAYVVKGQRGTTIIAGYPWFTDWGRDTFISMRGLCISTGRLSDAWEILANWSEQVSEGMLPNRFPDNGQAPEFNSVDASLWFVIAVNDFLKAAAANYFEVDDATYSRLWNAVRAILDGYTKGTRHRIGMDPTDGLLRAGEPGVQLTWMDARVGERVITPRIGKPVEIQALWINALAIGAERFPQFRAASERASASFLPAFWNGQSGCLFDVVDCDHVRGRQDASLRPNQIFAVGGLPLPLVGGERARSIVEKVESKLLTAAGLRTLSPDDPRYAAHYGGDVTQRDEAYHQGTVWPYLMTAFVEAWLRVKGNTQENRAIAKKRFAEPLAELMQRYGLGHLPEIADGDAPFSPRGCPFQAWSMGEFIRLRRDILQIPL